MGKYIEDVLFDNDAYNKVLTNCFTSEKSKTGYNYVILHTRRIK